jgi:hypothetical protein
MNKVVILLILCAFTLINATIPKTYDCVKTSEQMTVDGKTLELSWSAAQWTDYFIDIEGDYKPLPYYKTRVKMLWDDEYLYFYAEMEEDHIWAYLSERDAVIYHDNDFEIFIDPDNDTFNYYELEFNALGTLWDLMLTKPYKDNGQAVDAWDVRGIKYAVDLNGTLNDPSDKDEGWNIEVAIPWSALEECARHSGAPYPGEEWKINFSRVEWDTDIIGGKYIKITGHPEHNWVWSPQGEIAMHLPERWGVVKFVYPLSLVSKGGSAYSIVIPKKASREEIRASKLMKDYIKKVSDCDLPVSVSDRPAKGKSIIISKSDNISEADGFLVRTDNENIIIEGGDDKGCIYGVCEFLERFAGIKYYSPDYVLIPENKDIGLACINISGSSPNTYRNVHGTFSENKDYKDFRRLDDIKDAFADNYYVHTFNKLVPWQAYFKDHPEYFCYMNGKRIIDQLCLTNPDVLKITVEKLKKEMKRQPDQKVWSVSQNDNFSYCQCNNCKKIIEEEKCPAGPLIRFINKVAEKFPDKTISTLAYKWSRKAPELTKPRDNVQVMLCTIELNRSKSIEADPGSASFLTDIDEWRKICDHIYLWDYTVDFAHHYCPFPNLHVLQPNIQLFVNKGVKEHFQQSNIATGHEFSELKSYLLSKLLWDPDSDAKKIIDEFIDGYYGKAAPWITRYIYHLQDEVIKTGERLDIYAPPTNYKNTFLSAQNISDYNYYFDEAEKASAEDTVKLLHVRTARMQLQYAMMEIGKSDMFGTRGWYVEKNGDFTPDEKMMNALNSFERTAIEAGCKYVNESGLSVEEYCASTKRFINMQVKDNLAFRKKVKADPLPAQKYSEGDLALLTNGVRGANDFRVHWLGWEAKDCSLTLDLDQITPASRIEISTLWDPTSWIFHPLSISCSVSDDGFSYRFIDMHSVVTDQKEESVNRTFAFNTPTQKFRYIRFDIKGTIHNYDWHASAGGDSWFFVDEIVVK